MYRITIVGRDLKEFQENLKAYAEVHLGSIKGKETSKPTKTKISEQLLSEPEEDMEEVESPFNVTPSVKSAPVVEEEVTAHDPSELDAEGFPWDKRIHASSKQKVADGSWRKRRNLDETIYNSVRAELESKGFGKNINVNAPAATPVVETPQVQVAPTVEAPVSAPQVTATPTATPVAQPVTTQAAPVLPQMTGGHSLQTFCDNFPMVLAGLINEKKLTQEWVNSLNAHYGVTEIWTLNNEQKAQVFDLFVQNGLIQKVG